MKAIPQDKCLHVIAGAMVFAVMHAVPQSFGPAWAFGFAMVAAAGVAKEVLDHFTGGDVSAWDVLATCIGGALALACHF
ncbi:hypothetical protein [Paraburkholderia unamae]|uniref:hypothetical protein n=1 Tax=Paraburkholderia unamae TaxID=219649 RepID=UPI0011BF3CFE|nr:hypothetical protein [Paraburkholderia unamae]